MLQAQEMQTFKLALLDKARSLGLDAVGICSAEPFEDERRFMATRVPNPFEHPVLDERVDPEAMLPGVRSIVACAISYHEPDVPKPDGLYGWLSRYCRGLDYHTVLVERLEALARWIEAEVPGARAVTHSDIGPPLDRAIAARAGIGRMGKSTLLIVPRLGTMTFLGEVFTTVPLPADEPANWSPCGSCTRCLDACPTGALTPWQLDHEACLGYHNQMEGFIPEQYRAALGDRMFGCDTCQDVCPYNRAALSGLHPEFAPLEEPGAWLDLEALLAMTPEEFERQFAPTAAAWRGLETLQRNALVVLGNTGDVAAFGPLARALEAQSPLLRGHAAWGLAKLFSMPQASLPRSGGGEVGGRDLALVSPADRRPPPPVGTSPQMGEGSCAVALGNDALRIRAQRLLESSLTRESSDDVRQELTRAIARLQELPCN